jgi:hypothetical protein
MADFQPDKVSLSLGCGLVFLAIYLVAGRKGRNLELAKAAEAFASGCGFIGTVWMAFIAMAPPPAVRNLVDSGQLRILLFLGALSVGWLSISTLGSCVQATKLARATLDSGPSAKRPSDTEPPSIPGA